MTTNNDNIRIHVLHTGRVCVSPGLPFKDTVKNPNPVQLSLLTPYGRRRIWLPVSAYLIEHPQGNILFDTGWGRELSPDGCYDRIAQIRLTGHTSGMAAMKITRGEKYVLLFADGGYAEKSWKEMIPPGTALDNEAAMKSLAWIREMALSPNCVEALANHDPDVIPHEILL